MNTVGERQWGVILALTATVVIGWVLGFAGKAVHTGNTALLGQPSSVVESRQDGLAGNLELRSTAQDSIIRVTANTSRKTVQPVVFALGK